jgi:hypothetical protein
LLRFLKLPDEFRNALVYFHRRRRACLLKSAGKHAENQRFSASFPRHAPQRGYRRVAKFNNG